MRMMGKRQIGQLQPFELVIAIMVSDLASIPMQDIGIPLLYGIIPIVTLLFIQILLSFIQLKSEGFRKILCGKPSILIKNGQIQMKELRCQRFNLNDLMEELRIKGYFNLEDIEYAILETSGQISVIAKTCKESITKEDMCIESVQEKLPITLVLDGKIADKNIALLKKDRKWLYNLFKKSNIKNEKELIVAVLDSKGKFYYQKRDANEK
jgi:Predicted membrane protein